MSYPAELVLLTGIAELAGAYGLLIPSLRPATGIALALYAPCVWPANINHALQAFRSAAPPRLVGVYRDRLAVPTTRRSGGASGTSGRLRRLSDES